MLEFLLLLALLLVLGATGMSLLGLCLVLLLGLGLGLLLGLLGWLFKLLPWLLLAALAWWWLKGRAPADACGRRR